jgi:glycerol uptake facilitator-like aquaporin
MANILPFHNKEKTESETSKHVKLPKSPSDRRLARLGFAPNWVRNEAIAFIAEFAGTFMFLFMAFAATQVANAAAPATANNALSQYPNSANLLYISLAFGFSLATNAWAFFRISGGLFNPAVSLISSSVTVSQILTMSTGNPRPLPYRRYQTSPRSPRLHSTNALLDLRSRHC